MPTETDPKKIVDVINKNKNLIYSCVKANQNYANSVLDFKLVDLYLPGQTYNATFSWDCSIKSKYTLTVNGSKKNYEF